MISWFVTTFREYPELAIFLTLALGFWLGNLKIGGFSLGVVTATLLAGVLVGQMNIEISGHVKAVFFMMFLFAVGYGVGPQFFNGLKSDGLRMVMIGLVMCVSCLLSVFLVAKVAGLDVGQTAGLLAGACTKSAALGMSTDTISMLSLPPETKAAFIAAVPVAFALSYVYGTAGTAWILATLGPKILGVNLAEECAKYEKEKGGGSRSGEWSAYVRFVVRAFRVTEGKFIGQTVAALEQAVASKRVVILRVRQGDRIVEAQPDTRLEPGAALVLVGPREAVLENGPKLGPEVDDSELLNFPIEILDVVVTSKAIIGMTLQQLVEAEERRFSRGVYLRKYIRGGQPIPFFASTKIERGDVLQVSGPVREVERVAAALGYADRATDQTDMVFMGAGVVIGGLLGTLTLNVAGVPLSLSASGGALVAGLVCGWLRSVNHLFGRIPEPALWVFNNVGLNVFIAVIGINAGPTFIAGVMNSGVTLVVCGIAATTLPLLITILFCKYAMKVHPGVVLGACAGGRSATAALGAVEQAANSAVPRLGYSVPYALSNVLLTTWGSVIVYMMS